MTDNFNSWLDTVQFSSFLLCHRFGLQTKISPTHHTLCLRVSAGQSHASEMFLAPRITLCGWNDFATRLDDGSRPVRVREASFGGHRAIPVLPICSVRYSRWRRSAAENDILPGPL